MGRFVAVVLGVVTIVSIGWIVSLPNKAECVASGRIVDPTERHCNAAGGYQQLQEHATFHATEVGLAIAVLVAGGYAVRRIVRRRVPGPPAA